MIEKLIITIAFLSIVHRMFKGHVRKKKTIIEGTMTDINSFIKELKDQGYGASIQKGREELAKAKEEGLRFEVEDMILEEHIKSAKAVILTVLGLFLFTVFSIIGAVWLFLLMGAH